MKNVDNSGWPLRMFLFYSWVYLFQDYLLGCARPEPWVYHSEFLTDQHPLEVAKQCVREKLMDHIPHEIPYQLHVVSIVRAPYILSRSRAVGYSHIVMTFVAAFFLTTNWLLINLRAVFRHH